MNTCAAPSAHRGGFGGDSILGPKTHTKDLARQCAPLPLRPANLLTAFPDSRHIQLAIYTVLSCGIRICSQNRDLQSESTNSFTQRGKSRKKQSATVAISYRKFSYRLPQGGSPLPARFFHCAIWCFAALGAVFGASWGGLGLPYLFHRPRTKTEKNCASPPFASQNSPQLHST